jgi:hypothetical protein
MNNSKRPRRVGDNIMGYCVDCGRPSRARDEYIVRGSVWLEGGMGAWDAGYLHRPCLEKRIGRGLTEDDLLVWVESETAKKLEMGIHPDYLTSSEYLRHGWLNHE